MQNAVIAGVCADGVAGAEHLEGRTVIGVEARGKHLIVRFDNDYVLHSHMGMNGSWRIQAAGPHRTYAGRFIELCTALHRIVCVRPRQLRVMTTRQLERDPCLQRLGPDLLDTAVKAGDLAPRFRQYQSSAIGVVMMDQTVVSGIGNVYKSEMLFLQRIHPQTQIEALSDSEIVGVCETTVRLMKRNLNGVAGMRRIRTRGDGIPLWVYQRSGQHCLKCDDTIRMLRQGEQSRSTYFCPTCQQKP